VVDLPFGSYQGNTKRALESSIRIMKESGAHAVKLEGGAEVADSIKRILTAGIPVMGHLGLTPQSIYKFGTYNVRAKEKAEAIKLKEDAQILEQAGCFSLVLEKIPANLATEVTQSINIPTIGIGASADCDGQILVCYDYLGMVRNLKPKFVKQFAQVGDTIVQATRAYVDEVRAGTFPTATHCFRSSENNAPNEPAAHPKAYGPTSEH